MPWWCAINAAESGKGGSPISKLAPKRRITFKTEFHHWRDPAVHAFWGLDNVLVELCRLCGKGRQFRVSCVCCSPDRWLSEPFSELTVGRSSGEWPGSAFASSWGGGTQFAWHEEWGGATCPRCVCRGRWIPQGPPATHPGLGGNS